MFSRLKEKLKNWTKKLIESKETEEPVEKLEKPKKKKERIKEIKLSQKFNIVAQKFEPDLKEAEEIVEDIIKGKKEEKLSRESELTKSSPKEELNFFQKITSKISKTKITEKEFDVYAEELGDLLIENNVALDVAEKIIKELKGDIVGKELLKKEVESEIYESFREIIRRILIEPFDIIKRIKELKSEEKPYVILFCGINGTGKTTTIAKIAEYLKKNDLSCILAAADTFRAASIEQIEKHGERLGVKVISHEYGSDPAAVGFDAIKYAKKNRIDAVLIDTAGRMHPEKNLMKEIEKIPKVTKPNLKLFIGESITGNDAIEQAKSFDWTLGIDGIILTKADIDEKGGTSLSVGYVIKKPILFLGTGQDYDAIEPFNKEKFIEKLGL